MERRARVLQPPTKRRRKPGTLLLHGLRGTREDRNLSIRDLAKLAELSPDTVWQLERLRRGAESKTRRKLAHALGVKIRDLKMPPEGEADNE